ncbi:CRP-like cAMP-binding protein [Thiogranum longum]|uniref:CRP-like cAMP-binding protein n=1 Tax=Thiogranum longum TaxID=1537524 RepID=A0A4R1H8L4_9GAMM|nr:Crp/Fnr family transcriptional regulator [Thiogranum longum]TCK17588.1 CRP-like cAMP-binding protein [Thiogranum longum]
MSNRIQLSDQARNDALVFMRESILFQKLDEGQLDTIVQSTQAASLDEGQVLFEQERPASEIFMLESGQIKLARLSPEGHEKVIDLITPGSTFAEAIMFSLQPLYPVTATALQASQVLCFDAGIYTDILHQSTEACFSIMAQMSRRLHWQIAEIDRLTLHNATFRVVAYLLDQVPSTDRGASRVQLNIPKHVIASRLSITPETLSRTFSKLNRDGLIDIDDSGMVLRDVGQLRNYARGGNA